MRKIALALSISGALAIAFGVAGVAWAQSLRDVPTAGDAICDTVVNPAAKGISDGGGKPLIDGLNGTPVGPAKLCPAKATTTTSGATTTTAKSTSGGGGNTQPSVLAAVVENNAGPGGGLPRTGAEELLLGGGGFALMSAGALLRRLARR